MSDDEAPDDDEEFEQAEQIGFDSEFELDDGSTDNQTNEEAAAEIQTELFEIYDKLNPFEGGETTVEVIIVDEEVCETPEDDPSLNEADITDDEACEADETESTRKRRFLFKKKGKKKKKKKAKVKTWFKSKWNSTTSWSKKKMSNLKNKVSEKTKSSKALKALGSFGNKVWDSTKKTAVTVGQSLSNSYLVTKNKIKKGLTFLGIIKKPEINYNFKLENWMGTMPSHMKELPVTLLAIPGTHDSHTHVMQKTMTSSQDSPAYGKVGSRVTDAFGGIKHVVAAWGRCLKPQHNVYEQLRLGLRYFDFR